MDRKEFVKLIGVSVFALTTSGFNLIEKDGLITTDCLTSSDMLGPFFRKGAPRRNDISYQGNKDEIPLKVIGQVFGSDCSTPLKHVDIDVWHCDHKQDYDMKSKEYRCRGKIKTNEKGEYWFKTFIPPHYGGRPKHIHYLVDDVDGYQRLATQLYFKGDQKIKRNNWIKYKWDQKRILEIYKNEDNLSEVKLNLYLTPKA